MSKTSKVIYAVLPVLSVITLIGVWTLLSIQEGTLIPTPLERRVVVKQYNSKRVKTLCFQGTA